MASISTPYYKALDFTLIFLGCSIAYWVRFGTFSLPLYYFLPTVVFALLSTLTLGIADFYQTVNSTASSKQAAAAISGLVISAILTVACLYLTKTGEDYSRIWLLTSVAFAFFFLIVIRIILRKIFHISSGARTIVLLGSGNTADWVMKNFDSLDADDVLVARHFKVTQNNHTQTIDAFSEITSFIEQQRKSEKNNSPVNEVWITYDVFSRFSHNELRQAFNDSTVTLIYIPEVPDLNSLNKHQIQMTFGVPTINSNFSKNKKLGKLLKFMEDQIISWAVLILISPMLLVIAIAIKGDSKGPIFFRQTRYGLGGKDFLIWKFRTMHEGESQNDFKQARRDDPRVTRVGKWLRRTSLDELPQLFNVINGSMSLVGPRPHPVKLNEQYRANIDHYMYRHVSKPGITGLAQVKGFRGETIDPKLMEQRVKFDLQYIRNWSIFLDLKLLALTFIHIITTDKAH